MLVEHDMDLVAAYSHRIIALSEGKVLADLPPEPIFCRPGLIETVIGKAQERTDAARAQTSSSISRAAASCAAFRSRSQPASWSAWSAATAPARRRRLRTIMGFRKPAAGTIALDGSDIVGLRPYRIARMGVGFAPEESEVFGELTVAENIAHADLDLSRRAAAPRQRIDDAYGVFPKLERYRERGGQALSGGERKMVSIARALALDPKLLLLDEPTEGLSPAIVPSIVEGLAEYPRLRPRGLHRRIQHPPRAGFHRPALRHRTRRDHLRRQAGEATEGPRRGAGDRGTGAHAAAAR